MDVNLLNDQTPEEKELVDVLNTMLAVVNKKQEKIVRATEEEWADINKTEHIVTIDKELKAKTKSVLIKEDLEALAESVSGKKILKGVIEKVRPIETEKPDLDGSKAKALEEAKVRNAGKPEEAEDKYSGGVATWVAEVSFGNGTCEVLIPSYHLFHYNVLDNRTAEQERLIHLRMMDMVGDDIEFVVTAVQKGKRRAFGSRIDALAQVTWANYIRQTISTKKPRVVEGSHVEAKIVAVRMHEIVVNVMGAETSLRCDSGQNNLSNEYISNCTDVYKNNQIIEVVVDKIRIVKKAVYGNKYNVVSLQVHAAAVDEDPMEEIWGNIYEGEVGSAVITHISNARVFVKYRNKVTVLCKYPERGATYVGQRRKIQITIKKIDPEKGKRLFGKFVD